MKTFILLSLSLSLCAMSLATPVRVALKIQDNNGNSIKGATVKLYKMSQLIMIEEYAPSALKWELESGERYTIEVSLEGFITKRMGITTRTAGSTDADEHHFTLALENSPFTRDAVLRYSSGPPSEVIRYENGQWTLSAADRHRSEWVREPE